jgi:WXXGXW repeat (2 copies)
MMRTLGGLLIGVVLAGAGCYSDEYASQPAYATARPVTVAVPPPAPVDEVPPPEPYPGAVWMAGYWDWRADQNRHVWVAGHWATPPRAGVAYMPPSWHADPHGGYYRMPGRWVAAPTRDAYGRHIAYDSYGRPHYF